LLMPSLRMLIGGGAACPPEVHRQVREYLRVPVVHAYGMTEAPMICVSEVTDTDEQLANSAGRPIRDRGYGSDRPAGSRCAAATSRRGT